MLVGANALFTIFVELSWSFEFKKIPVQFNNNEDLDNLALGIILILSLILTLNHYLYHFKLFSIKISSRRQRLNPRLLTKVDI